MSCSKERGFRKDEELSLDGAQTIVRKIKIFLLNGTLIQSVSVPQITGYTPTADDDLAVQVVNSGIRVAYTVNGIGNLIEVKQYRNDIGVRLHMNAFSYCKTGVRLFSDGKQIFAQDGKDLHIVDHEFEINCDNIYVDHWTVLRKIADCQQLPALNYDLTLMQFEPIHSTELKEG